MRNALLLSMALLAGTMPVSADQPATNQTPPLRFGAQRPADPNPYASLFEPNARLLKAREALKQAQQAAGKTIAPKKKIVCGMTMIEADPSFDQKMKVTPPKDPNVRYTIRGVEPPICK